MIIIISGSCPAGISTMRMLAGGDSRLVNSVWGERKVVPDPGAYLGEV